MDDIPYIEVAYDIDFNEEEAEDITEFIKNKIPQKYKYSIKKVLKYIFVLVIRHFYQMLDMQDI